MKISKNFCTEAKSALAQINKQFSPQPVYVRPVKKRPYRDMFNRSLKDEDCVAADKYHNFDIDILSRANWFAVDRMGISEITDERVSQVIEILKQFKKLKKRDLSYMYENYKKEHLLLELKYFLDQDLDILLDTVDYKFVRGKYLDLGKVQF